VKQTGKQLHLLSDILFLAFIFMAVIFGLLYMTSTSGPSGFLIFLIIMAVGVLFAFVYRYLFKGFAELIENQAAQTELISEMAGSLQEILKNQRDAAVTGTLFGNPSNAPYVSRHDDSGPAAPEPQPEDQTALFKSRSLGAVICPVCHKTQLTNRDVCSSCGCRFVYADEAEHMAQ
jgi:hypothetical protein